MARLAQPLLEGFVNPPGNDIGVLSGAMGLCALLATMVMAAAMLLLGRRR